VSNGGVNDPVPVRNIQFNNPHIEMNTLPPTHTVPDTPLPYATAPNTPIPNRHQVKMPNTAQSAPTLTDLNGGMAANGMAPCMTSPQSMPMAYGAAPVVMPGMPAYQGAMPMQPMFAQPPMGMAPAVQPAGLGNNPNQNGGINLVVNTNANANSNSDAKGSGGAGGGDGRPAPRPCPKCRLGYITRGQARFREMCIKVLAYGTICCTCLLPLQLLKTNYVDKCSYCGEEYGFRGELFEKPKPPKM
ncbi:hypothetical protein GCK32_017081, partial [Trichostrongylus colubriformis]